MAGTMTLFLDALAISAGVLIPVGALAFAVHSIRLVTRAWDRTQAFEGAPMVRPYPPCPVEPCLLPPDHEGPHLALEEELQGRMRPLAAAAEEAGGQYL